MPVLIVPQLVKIDRVGKDERSVKDWAEWRRKFEAAHQEDLRAGRARIGGPFWFGGYRESYLAAASVLVKEGRSIGDLSEHAVPALYLQRHALELMLKDLLYSMYGMADDSFSLAQLRGAAGPSNDFRPSEKERRRATSAHDLSALMADLVSAFGRASSAGFAFRPLPPDLEQCVKDFAVLEDGAATRLRYDRVRLKNRADLERSFPERVGVPIEGFQARLLAIEAELFTQRVEPPSLADEIYMEHLAIDQALEEEGER